MAKKKKPAPKPASKPAKPAKPEKSSGTDEFDSVVSGAKYKKAWKEARKVDAGDGGTPTLPDGEYIARVSSASVGVTKGEGGKPKIPFFKINAVITQGEYKGTTVPYFHSLEPDRMEWAVKAAKRLGYEFDEDATPSDMKGIAEDLNETKPAIAIACKNSEKEVIDKQTKKKKKVKLCNWYINRVIDEDSMPDDDEEVEEDEETTEEEEEEEEGEEEGEEEEEAEEEEEEESEEEEEEEAEEDDEEEDVIEKGNHVNAKLAGDKKPVEYVVLKVNEKAQTADVRGVKRKNVVRGVALDKLELVYEEDDE